LPLATAICLAIGSMPCAWAQSDVADADAAAQTTGDTTDADATADATTAADADAAAQDQDQDQDSAASGSRTLDAVIVTSQKREENLQEVPISIQVLGVERLQELEINDFEDYAKYLPTVSYQSFGPGFSLVYMRGVASGGDGNHSGPLPSVGVYLDEQPITTIQGALDLHIYDIERVESLAGPQGTLYGASSQSGTIRIITNKPDPSGFSAAYGIEGNTIDEGGSGYIGEGYVNWPIAENAAIRLVAWTKQDAGYIDNVAGTHVDAGIVGGVRTYPTAGISDDSAPFQDDDYNEFTTNGARAALKVDLWDTWSFTPTVMYQQQKSDGFFAFDPEIGDLEVTHFNPERSEDEFTQAALTVQGKIGNFDLVYAFANLNRDVDTESDYSDYSFFYDALFGYVFYDDAGELVNPSQYIQGRDIYRKRSHELRISSPADNRFRATAGLFYQEQKHDIQQRYRIDNIASDIEVTGFPDTIWLTKQEREDDDKAFFGELSFDFTDRLTVNAGIRFFEADNSLKGFFGYGAGFSGSTGEAACFDETDFNGAPCVNLDKETNEDDHIGRFNVTYDLTDDAMIYATWSEGYRPGGINRRGTLPPYLSDFLTNYEFGWKTTWADNSLSWNGAIFQEDWEDFQFALLGANGLTEIKNANQAEIRGIEMDLQWAVTYNFTLSSGVAFYDSELTADYCGFTDEDGTPITTCPPGTINPITGEPVEGPEAPEGTELPVTANFKGNVTGRYIWDMGDYQWYMQGGVVYEGDRESDLRTVANDIVGGLPSYVLVDLSAGFGKNNWKLDFFLKNAFDERAEQFRFAQCAETVCGAQTYTFPSQPRTFGVRFSQEF
jgi:outer membrane receptor protein involved in Fe transport